MTLPWEIFQSAMFFVSACFTGMHAFLFLYFPKKLKRTFSLTGNLQKLYFTLSDSGGLSFFSSSSSSSLCYFSSKQAVFYTDSRIFSSSPVRSAAVKPRCLFFWGWRRCATVGEIPTWRWVCWGCEAAAPRMMRVQAQWHKGSSLDPCVTPRKWRLWFLSI